MPLNFMGNISKDKSLWTQDSGSYYSTNPSLQSSLVLLLTIYLLTEKSIYVFTQMQNLLEYARLKEITECDCYEKEKHFSCHCCFCSSS